MEAQAEVVQAPEKQRDKQVPYENINIVNI